MCRLLFVFATLRDVEMSVIGFVVCFSFFVFTPLPALRFLSSFFFCFTTLDAFDLIPLCFFV